MIASFTISGFKSYRDADLPLASLTLLIGANASGKSNLIEAIRLLSWLARGQRLSDALQASAAVSDATIRGNLTDLTYAGNGSFTLGCALTDLEAGEWTNLTLKMRVEVTGARVVEETITHPRATFPLYRVEVPAPDIYSHDIQVAYNNFSRGGVKPRITASDQQAVFTQLTTPARFGSANVKAQELIPRVAKVFQRSLDQILFLDPDPRRMRGYSFVIDRILKPDGANLSSVLHHLTEQTGQRDRVLDFVRSLPEQDIQDLDFLSTPRNEVMLQLIETFGGRAEKRDAPVLSDGTLRVLAVAAALLSAPEGSLVVIEEIDNGVHPSRARDLLNSIERVSKERSLRVLLTSHNPALLDGLPDEAVPNVVCAYRDPEAGDSRLVRLENLPNYPELVAQGPLGTLMTRGVLDRLVKDRRSEEQRERQSLDWLEGLKASANSEPEPRGYR